MVTTTLTAMDANTRDLFAASMRWMEPFWDESAGLLRDSGDTKLTASGHTVRGSAWYAFGLLLRNAAGDAARAARVIAAVLDWQFDASGRPFHGTFYRAPEEPYPPADCVIWRDYDPNWREFIITALALALLEYPERLPAALTARLDTAVRKAVAGALARGLSASYTNIALMYAYMLCFAGKRFAEPGWVAEGERMGREVYLAFKQHDSFAEYNSPTYYGVDLYALALWRSYPALSPLLAQWGAEMEALLWRDIARYYHAGLRNLAGPYDRSYGMDMRRYIAVVGLWMRLVLDESQAPLPALDRHTASSRERGRASGGEPLAPRPFEHEHDLGFFPLIAFLGTVVPGDALAHLRQFHGERLVEHLIAAAPRRVATAWLDTDRMLGAEFTSLQPPASKQLHPATLHWRIDERTTGWARMRYINPVDATASRNRLAITTTGEIAFDIFAPGTKVEQIGRENWELTGLCVHIESNADAVETQPRAELFDVRYRVAAGHPITCVLRCG